MGKQKDETKKDSRAQFDKVFEQEQAVSKAFQINNFYSNQRLNILELKQRLEQFKKHQKQPQPQIQSRPLQMQQFDRSVQTYVDTQYPSTFAAMTFAQLPQQKEQITLPYAKRARLSYYDNTNHSKQFQHIRNTVTPDFDRVALERIQEVKQTNYRIVKQIKRNDGKIRTSYGLRQNQTLNPPSNNSQYSREPSSKSRGKGENLNTSKCSNSSHKKSISSQNWGLEGIILIQSRQQLIQYQKQINTLWQHYQLLTKILVGLREGYKHQKNALVKYVQDVCTNRFQFIRDMMSAINRQGAQKGEHMFIKRLKKAVILSRLLENLSILYVGLGICHQHQPQAYLVNFVGYCCSNITFLIRLILLMHTIGQGYKVSAPISHIIEVIKEFEEGSYKQVINRVSDVVLRMDQNNNIIGIVQGKLCNSMEKEFQKTISTFLKYVDFDSKPLHQYSHYIYQFLAFHLSQQNIVGQFSFLQIAPSPYFTSLPKLKTLVIEPWEVLIASKGTSIFIRSYSDTFLRQIGKHWNIIYWTDLMPDIIDNLLVNLPPGKVLYRYHCRYENDRYLKLLWRLGCDNDNIIIVDRDDANFKYDREMGIAMPWKGQKKDNKFLQLLSLLHKNVLIDDKCSLRKAFPSIKQTFLSKKKQRKSNHSSEQREEIQSFLPRAVTKKKGSRLQNYQY